MIFQLITSTIWYLIGLIYAYYMYNEFHKVHYIPYITLLYIIIYTIAYLGTLTEAASTKNINHTYYVFFIICSVIAFFIPFLIEFIVKSKCLVYKDALQQIHFERNIEMQPIKTKIRTRKTNLSQFNPKLDKNTSFLSVRNAVKQSKPKNIPKRRQSDRQRQMNPLYKT